jgi:hypothetical protein
MLIINAAVHLSEFTANAKCAVFPVNRTHQRMKEYLC